MLWGIKPFLWWWLLYLCGQQWQLRCELVCAMLTHAPGLAEKFKVSQSLINLLNRNWAWAQTPAVLKGQCYRDGKKNWELDLICLEASLFLFLCLLLSFHVYPSGDVQLRQPPVPICMAATVQTSPPDSLQLSQERQSLLKARYIQLLLIWVTVAAYCKPVSK